MVNGRRFIVVAIAIIMMVLTGCVREPLPASCADVFPDELVVTEIASLWIEVANVGGRDLDLRGLDLRLRRLDGSGDQTAVIRTAVALGADGYAVLAGVSSSWPDYSFGTE